MSTSPLFKWRHFLPKIILLNVRWYCRYALSSRDLEEMMCELNVPPEVAPAAALSMLNQRLMASGRDAYPSER